MTAADRLAQIRARVEDAAEGPWESVDDFASDGDYMVRQRDVRPDEPDSIACEIGHEPTADFIAHARADVPALLAAVEAVLSISTETIAASLALSRGSHVSPPRGGADYRAAEAVVDLIHAAIEGALA